MRAPFVSDHEDRRLSGCAYCKSEGRGFRTALYRTPRGTLLCVQCAEEWRATHLGEVLAKT